MYMPREWNAQILQNEMLRSNWKIRTEFPIFLNNFTESWSNWEKCFIVLKLLIL